MFSQPLSHDSATLLAFLCARHNDVVWLDSATGDGLSLIAFESDNKKTFSTHEAHTAFRSFFENFCFASPTPEKPIFAGGWIGYLSYESFAFNPLIPFAPQHPGTYPLSVWRHYDTFLELKNQVWHFVSYARDAEKKYHRFLEDLTKHASPTPAISIGPIQAHTDFADYQKNMTDILSALHKGDYLELNYTIEFSASCAAPEIWPLYLALRAHCPAPMMAFYNWPEVKILSASPECFFKIDPTGTIRTYPIKGTIARGETAAADSINQKKLQSGQKEKSELLMVTDLLRNDLGRICEVGSVQTPQLFALNTFSHYHHLISEIVGQIIKQKSFYDVFCALFPGGSITGAPKIQVMRDIERLEKRARGIYTGALGFLSDSGFCEFNIPIRTLTHDGSALKMAVGGGIVAESSAGGEYEECLVKLAGLKKALSIFSEKTC